MRLSVHFHTIKTVFGVEKMSDKVEETTIKDWLNKTVTEDIDLHWIVTNYILYKHAMAAAEFAELTQESSAKSIAREAFRSSMNEYCSALGDIGLFGRSFLKSANENIDWTVKPKGSGVEAFGGVENG
jgi:hypothetical protein